MKLFSYGPWIEIRASEGDLREYISQQMARLPAVVRRTPWSYPNGGPGNNYHSG